MPALATPIPVFVWRGRSTRRLHRPVSLQMSQVQTLVALLSPFRNLNGRRRSLGRRPGAGVLPLRGNGRGRGKAVASPQQPCDPDNPVELVRYRVVDRDDARERRMGCRQGVVGKRWPVTSTRNKAHACMLILVGVSLASPPLGAQDAPPASGASFRDTNRLIVGNGDARFEAVVGGDLLVWNRRWSHWQEWNGWGMNVYGSALMRLRMTHDRSSPVRTPSFEPKATAQFIRRKVSHSTRSELIINIVPWGHHSNGQEGCSLLHHNREPALDGGDGLGKCRPDEGVDTNNSGANLKDGSFSTNYSRVGLYGSWTRAKQTVTVGGELERHHSPDSWFPGALSPELYDRYGKLRTAASIRYAREACCGRVEFRYWYQRISGIRNSPDAVDEATRNVNIVEAVLYPGRVRNWGLYGRYYRGRDYYNIHFEQEVRRIEAGFSFTWQGVAGGLTGTPTR